jgi:hypothetical protein
MEIQIHIFCIGFYLYGSKDMLCSVILSLALAFSYLFGCGMTLDVLFFAVAFALE